MDTVTNDPEQLRAQILRLTREYSQLVHRGHQPGETRTTPFVPGKTPIPYAGRVFDADEVEAAVDSSLEFWLTLGRHGESFEQELASFLGVRSSVLTNSGSSANLLAVVALTTHKLPENRRLRPGDEVITVAAGFPTTVAPIIQAGAVPVFIDNSVVTGNARVEQLEAAFVPGKTKAVIMAHTLGNPFDLGAVLEFCQRHDLWLIEDNCDALGCTYSMPAERAKALGFTENSPGIPGQPGVITRYTGSWGDLSTQSFYPPHHITMGEGGAVNIVRKAALRTYVESFRDWGRDCWCAGGTDNTCGKRFEWQLGELPAGYDHKYTYSHLGYNLKMTDMQAAVGHAQLAKLDGFGEARRRNWRYLRERLDVLAEQLVLPEPTEHSDPSWFGFMTAVRPGAGFTRDEMVRHLESRRVQTRMLFSGNLTRQPALTRLAEDCAARGMPAPYRVAGDLERTDFVMNQGFWIGVFPGMSEAMLAFMADEIIAFATSRKGSAPRRALPTAP